MSVITSNATYGKQLGRLVHLFSFCYAVWINIWGELFTYCNKF